MSEPLFPGFKVSPADPSRDLKPKPGSFESISAYMGEDDDDEFDEPYCDRCANSGSIDCFCGGDLCVCSYNGEKPCPDCGRM